MRRYGVGVLLLCFASLCWAGETTVIYRKSDRLYVGKVVPPQSVETEIENLTKSSLGGTKEDYATVVLPDIPQGKRPVIAADGTALTEDYPGIKVRQDRVQAVRNALKNLGLTDDVVNDVIR